MPVPRIEIDLDKLAHNARKLTALYGSKGICVTAVTKGVCGSPRIASALLNSGIRSFGDSRIANIQKMREAGLDAQFILIRSPMPSEVERVVEFADVSLNTEISVIRLLAREASKRDKIHRIILMIELGDLREGILPSDVEPMVAEVIGLRGVKLIGIGTNLACLGGVRPTEANMQELSAIVGNLQQQYGIKFEIVSGGNSANYQWFVSTLDVGLVNHLRIGEAILLGCDTLTREPIPGLYTDAFTLVAEVIELKTKPSRPHGEIAQDAFGRVPVFEDKEDMERAILALGRQDVDVSAIKPRIKTAVLGASSDCLILGVNGLGLEVGAEVRFDVQYSALLRAMTSPYVEKVHLSRSHLRAQGIFSSGGGGPRTGDGGRGSGDSSHHRPGMAGDGLRSHRREPVRGNSGQPGLQGGQGSSHSGPALHLRGCAHEPGAHRGNRDSLWGLHPGHWFSYPPGLHPAPHRLLPPWPHAGQAGPGATECHGDHALRGGGPAGARPVRRGRRARIAVEGERER